MASVFQTYWIPSAYASLNGWTVVGSNGLATVVSDPPSQPLGDGNTSYLNAAVNLNLATSLSNSGFNLSPPPTTIYSVSLYAVVVGNGAAIGLDYSISGTNFTSAGGSFTTVADLNFHAYQSTGDALNPKTSAPWTLPDLQAMQILLAITNPTQVVKLTQFYAIVSYQSLPPRGGLPRASGSQDLRLKRKMIPTAAIEGPLSLANREICDPQALAVFWGQDEAGVGWGGSPWQLRRVVKLSEDLDLDTLQVGERVLDVRDYMTHFWDGMKQPSSLQAVGMAPRLDLGVARIFSRTGAAWVEDPVDGRIVAVGTNAEKFAQAGELIEVGGVTNILLHSQFDGGLAAPWSTNTSGTGSAVAMDATVSPWDKSLAPSGCVKLTAPNPQGATQTSVQQTISLLPSTTYYFAIEHRDETGGTMQFFIEDTTAATFWDSQTQTWVAAVTATSLPLSPAGSFQRDFVKVVTAAVSHSYTFGVCYAGTNITVIRGGPNMTPGAIGHIGSVETRTGEAGSYLTSRIYTTTAAVTRAFDDLKVENRHGFRTWPARRGTFYFEFASEWNLADLPAASIRTLWSCEYDATDYDRIFYDQATGTIRFRRVIAGTTYDSFISLSAVRLAKNKVTLRWTGAEGELGLAPYTMSTFLGQTKGTDVVAVTPPGNLPTVGYLKVGYHDANLDYADAYFSNPDLSPFVKSDAEIMDKAA